MLILRLVRHRKRPETRRTAARLRHYGIVRTRHPSLRDHVLAFADGPPADDNSLDAGTDGWSSKAWGTSDGEIVLHAKGTVGSGLRRRQIENLTNGQIDQALPRLTKLLDGTGRMANLLLQTDNAVVFDRVASLLPQPADIAGQHPIPDDAACNVWVASANLELLSRNRTRTSARLVEWASTSSPDGGLERRVATLHGYGIDALALPHREWTPGAIALCHRFGIMAYGWGCEHEREMANLIDIGIDAVQTPFPDRLVAVIQQYHR